MLPLIIIVRMAEHNYLSNLNESVVLTMVIALFECLLNILFEQDEN